MNIRRKILLMLLGVSLLPLALLFGFYATSFFEASRNSAGMQLSNLADDAAQRLDNLLLTAARDTKALASHLHAHPGNGTVVSEDLTGFTYSYPYFVEVLWVLPTGVVGSASNPAHAGQPLADVFGDSVAAFERALQQPAGQLQVSDLDVVTPQVRDALRAGSADGRALALQMLMRVDDPRGDPLGVLITAIHTDAIFEVLRNAQRRALGDYPVVLLNAQGDLLLSSASGRLLEAHPLTPVLALAGAFQTAPRAQPTYEVSDAQGTKVIAAVSSLSGLDGHSGQALAWRVLVSAPSDAVTAQARQAFVQSRLFVLAVLALVLGLGVLVARHLGHLIDALAKGAAHFSVGDFAHRIPLGPNDELGALGRVFNPMAEKIEVMLQDNSEALRHQEALGAAIDASKTELGLLLVSKEQQNREITLRNEMGDLLQSCITIEEAGAVIGRFLPLIVPQSYGAAYLATPGSETLLAVAHWGTPVAAALSTTDCWALRRGRTHLATQNDAALACAHLAAPLLGAHVCVALTAHGAALGLLTLGLADASACEPGALAQTQRLTEALATQIAVALGNLRLHQTLHQQSTHDALTGLYNRRYLEAALPREIARARRGDRSLAVLMLDVDHFKNFNDSYGHEAGDAVLKALGGVLRESCRQADIACRFGGEEFTMLLPDADEGAAREWGERLLQRVRTLQVKALGQTLPKVTISAGLALFPTHGEDGETLLQAADLALYDAKHAGRDRLMCSGRVHEQVDPDAVIPNPSVVMPDLIRHPDDEVKAGIA